MGMNSRKDVSIKNAIRIVFILAMLLSIGGIGYLIFNGWLSSAEKTTGSIVETIGEGIYNRVVSFMREPTHINDANRKIIENGILDLYDEESRDKFFVGVLSSQREEIYSFSYGTENGEYYGARRNEKGVIEIMRNNASTGGNSWYYSVNEDLTAGERVVVAGKFDPRTRAWYKAAQEAAGSAFSPIYKHFVMSDLTISAAWPVYDSDGNLRGVMGTHVLLSSVGAFLRDTVNDYNGYAILFEKDTGALIANSTGVDNFSVLSDGTLKRNTISEMEDRDIQQEYAQYATSGDSIFIYGSGKEKLFVNVREIQMPGIDWILISAIPEGLYMSSVVESVYLTALLVAFALAVSLIAYHIVIGRLIRPIDDLLDVSAALSSGDLSRRAEVVRNDEIGSISESLNRVADKMQFLINNLEESVEERTEQLYGANVALEENKNQLQLILDSTAEGIYGIDMNGRCTFCNISSVRMLGYSSPGELLGKNMHLQIHHSYRDGRPFPIDECRIFMSIRQGKGFEADDEVFWRADGTSFDVEYHSYPQIRNGEVVGGVITFMDITDRKKREAEIEYLSCHDVLTGLHNRSCFENSRDKIDIPDNLPLSVVFADINGLKITNDVFGHAAGDGLIKKSAEILRQSCRNGDVIARVGGDEFVMLLPKTDRREAEKILSRIKTGFSNARIEAIKCSVSLGIDTKTSNYQSLEETMANAENMMYKDKTVNRKSANRDIIDTIIETLHSKYPREKQHSLVVSQLCGEFGIALNLSKPEINVLKRAGYLHDIGKIVLEESLLSKDHMKALTEEEREKVRQHSIVGYRILNLFDETLDLAEYAYSHHERWDGKGYPRGLEGEQIPLIARIISIAETYDRVLNRGDGPFEERKRAALKAIKDSAGKQFDPELAGLFVQTMERGA
jgi:diguanylate cyclase (GGDEF)-like protein/PAS domain S-box-containing protein/putative nucleotidyltransferase with HDIG domain